MAYDYDRTTGWRLLDSVYQHIDNGGLTYEMWKKETAYTTTYHFKVRTNHFGSQTEYTFPLPGLAALDEVIGSFQRAREDMARPDFPMFDPFEHNDPYEAIRNGKEVTLREDDRVDVGDYSSNSALDQAMRYTL